MACLSLIILGLSFFLFGLSHLGMVISADAAIRGESSSLKEIWFAYTRIFWRWILVLLICAIPIGVVYICALHSMEPINTINDIQTRFLLAILIVAPFAGGIYTFSLYGLILHKLGVPKSVRHGLSVFLMNWLKFVLLSIFLEIPIYASYLVLWLIQLSAGNHPSLITLFSDASKFPLEIWFYLINTIVGLLSSVAFLLVYYQFIKEYDYPTLKQVTPTT